MTELSHFDASGQAHMVDVAEKRETHRTAVASGTLYMSAEAFSCMEQGDAQKGDVLGVARIAAIQGAKRTSELIPLCHPLQLTHIRIIFYPETKNSSLRLEARVETTGRTGVEMEALTAVSIGLLTVYDMLKGVDKGMTIGNIQLLSKQGGKSGTWQAEQD